MARALAEAFVRVRADTSGVRKDIESDFDDAGRRGGRRFGDAFTRDAQGRLHDARGRFVKELGDAGDDGGRDAGRRFSASFGGAFRSLGGRLAAALSGGLGGLGKLAGGARTAATGVAALAAAVGALNTAVQAGAALAPLAGLIAGIPAAAVAAGAAIGTLKLAITGMSDAFGAALSGDAKKLKDSLKDLAPAARNVTLELAALRPTLIGIRNVAQQALFAPLQGQLTAIARVMAGPLRDGVGQVAQQFGLAGRAAAEFARQSASVALVRQAFASTAVSIRSLLPAIQPVLAGLRGVAGVGLSFLPGLSASVAQVAQRFGAWLQQIVATGQASQWISNALATLRQLGQVAVNIGGILKSVFSAASAAGSNFLGVIGGVLSQLNAFLKTAQGQSALTAIFTTIGTIGATLGPVIGAIVTGLGALAPPLAQLAQLVGPILTTAITALAPALGGLLPGLQALFSGLGQAVTLLAPALVPLGRALGQIGVAIGPVLPLLGQLIGQLVANLAPILGQLFIALGPLVKAIVQLAGAFAPLITPLAQIIVQLVQGLVPAITPLVPVFSQIVGVVGQFLVAALGKLVSAITPLLPVISQAAVLFSQQLLQVLIALSPALLQIIDALLPLVPSLVAVIPPSVQLIAELTPLLVLLIKISSAIINTLLPPIVAVIGWLIRFQNSAVATAASVRTLVGRIAGLPGQIISIFGGAAKWLVNAGKNVMIGLWNGIVSMAGSIARWIGDLVRRIIPGPVRFALGINSPSRVMAEIGKFAGQGLMVGLDSTRSGVAQTASRLASAAIPAAGGSLGFAAAGAGGGGIDLGGLADAVADGLHRAGLVVKLDKSTTIGVLSRELGKQTSLRRKGG